MAEKKIPKPQYDMELFFEPGFEEKVSRSLLSNESTSKVFTLLRPQSSHRLVLLLCSAVFRRTQMLHWKIRDSETILGNLTIDDLVEQRTGTMTDNLENFPAQVERFCQDIWLHMHRNREVRFDMDCDNTGTYKRLIPTLLDFADSIAVSRVSASLDLEDWRTAYKNALRSLAQFIKQIKQETGRERLVPMARLLEETARALGLSVQTGDQNPIYDQKSIRDTLRYHHRRT